MITQLYKENDQQINRSRMEILKAWQSLNYEEVCVIEVLALRRIKLMSR